MSLNPTAPKLMPINDPARSDNPSGRSRVLRQGGFTLVELIMVMVLLGILAVYAVPKLNIGGTFSARGFGDQVRGQIQYAQKLAIAQRRNVCVAVTASAVAITKALSGGSGVGCTVTPQDFLSALPAPAGVSINTASIIFDALGQSVDSAGAPLTSNITVTVSGDVATTVTIEQVTGYVH